MTRPAPKRDALRDTLAEHTGQGLTAGELRDETGQISRSYTYRLLGEFADEPEPYVLWELRDPQGRVSTARHYTTPRDRAHEHQSERQQAQLDLLEGWADRLDLDDLYAQFLSSKGPLDDWDDAPF